MSPAGVECDYVGCAQHLFMELVGELARGLIVISFRLIVLSFTQPIEFVVCEHPAIQAEGQDATPLPFPP
jgi:hypothetical protein